MMTPGRALYLLRRDLRRGWRGSRHFYKTLPRISDWRRPFWTASKKSVPIHVLTGKDDWQLAGWMLASWFYFSEASWPIVIHDDGTLPVEAGALYKRLFEDVQVIWRPYADKDMERHLKAFPFCSQYRSMHPLALKVFDATHYAKADRLMIFDSDLLFFNYPSEILDWVERNNDETWFNEDVFEGSLVEEKEALSELHVKPWPKVNSGLCLLYKRAVEWEFCEQILSRTSILRGHIWRVEQTLLALCAAKRNKGGLLSKRYEVSVGKHAARESIARHYVGAVRDRFYGEGLERLQPVLLAD